MSDGVGSGEKFAAFGAVRGGRWWEGGHFVVSCEMRLVRAAAECLWDGQVNRHRLCSKNTNI